MNKFLLVTVLSIIMFVAGAIAYRWFDENPPELRVQEDEGRIFHQGEIATVTVTAVNRSGSPFLVESVITSCGCTKPMLGDTRLAAGVGLPGDSRTPITVAITTERDAGEVAHSIRISGHYLNSSRVQVLETKVRITVAAPATIVPSEILIAEAESGKPVIRDIYILEGGMGDARNVRVGEMSDPNSMHGQFHEATTEANEKVHSKGFSVARRYTLTLTPSPGDAEDRRFVNFLLPGAKGINTLRVNILCQKKPAGLVFSPALLSLSKSNTNRDVTREILCLTNNPDEVKIAVLKKPPDVQAVVQNLKHGKYTIALRIPAARAAAGTGFAMQIGSETGQSKGVPYQVVFTEPGR